MPGDFDSPKAAAVIVIAALAALVAIRRGFRQINVTVGS